jgi:hypothetical protein
MKTPMVGAKKTFQRTLDVLSRDSTFVQTGTWTIQKDWTGRSGCRPT